jgi:para-aminobenzoate synthetase
MPFFSYLTQLMSQYRLPAGSTGVAGVDQGGAEGEGLPFNFWGGPVGYLGYELKAECGGAHAHASQTPDAAMVVADRVVVVDHLQGDIFALAVYPPGEGEPASCDEVPLTTGGDSNGHCATSAAQNGIPDGRHGSQAWVRQTLGAIAALKRSEQPAQVQSNTDKEAPAVIRVAQPPALQPANQGASTSSQVFSLCHSKDEYLANIEGCKR